MAEVLYKGKTIEAIRAMSEEELAQILPARARRSLNRGFSEPQKNFLERVRKGNKKLKTHCRDLVITPELVGKNIGIYNGKEFVFVEITVEMLGHLLGEFAQTRKKILHKAPGVGATRSSKHISVK